MNRFIVIYQRFLGVFAGLTIALWIFVCPLAADTGISYVHQVKILVAETSLVNGPVIFLGEVAQIQASSFFKRGVTKNRAWEVTQTR